VPDEVGAFGRCEGGGEFTDRIPQGVDRAYRGRSQLRLQFREHHLNWVEVRAVGWQIQQLRTSRLDGHAYSGDLVNRQVVHDHDVIRAQRRRQLLLDVGNEQGAVHGPIDDIRRNHAALMQTADKSRRLVMAMRNRRDKPLAAGRAAVLPHHVRLDRGLVEKDQPPCGQVGLFSPPLGACLSHIRPLLLGGMQGLFFASGQDARECCASDHRWRRRYESR
jgi:hypothetical protein